MMPITETVKHLIIINVLIFLCMLLSIYPQALEVFGLYGFQDPNFRWFQLFTNMFVNGNILQILFNMYALYSLGSTLEHFWGQHKFMFFYISCGIGAGLISNVINQVFQINPISFVYGSTGAIFGLLIAFGFMFPEAGLMFFFIPYPIKAKYFIPGIIALDLIFSFGLGPIIHGDGRFEHIGGALVGFIMMSFWKKNQYKN